mmetsp:Transcript_26168/g.19657  ORF Transcript_26168/g.19657 Transcript_26168/m.19657 type:complete len:89 (+) Transcript_26168:719-985(+)
MIRSPSYGIVKPYHEKDLGWKPKKSHNADMGSYEVLKTMSATKDRFPQYSFPKSKSSKSHVRNQPSPVHYKVEKCFNHISRPYMKKRY